MGASKPVNMKDQILYLLHEMVSSFKSTFLSSNRSFKVDINGIRMALGERGMSPEQGRLNALDRRWELIVRSE